MHAKNLLCGLGLALLIPHFSPAQAAPLVILAGGGSEGDQGDTSSWSYALYSRFLDRGDINGDGAVTVAILSTGLESDWMPNYFKWLGADAAYNLWVPNRASADDPGEVDALRSADVIFIKGGDQGAYYDAWNQTRLEENLRYVVDDLGGVIGGTSAGAMSQAQYAFAGGQDLISLDILEDATTKYLDDASDGGSGIHDDFLGFVPGVIIETHYTRRARLGRLMGIQAKAQEDWERDDILAIGIEEQTGLVIENGLAEVVGRGSVSFIQSTPASDIRRSRGEPLIYTHARLDRLTDGWIFDLVEQSPRLDSAPEGSEPVTYSGHGPDNSGSLTVIGNNPPEVSHFETTATFAPLGYDLLTIGQSPFILRSIGILDAQDSDNRGAIHEALFRALYDRPDHLGFLITDVAKLKRSSSAPNLLGFHWNIRSTYRRAASIVVDGQFMDYKGLSPHLSVSDTGSGTLNAAAFTNLRVHILADSGMGEASLNTKTGALED